MAVSAEAVAVATTAVALNDGTPGRLVVMAADAGLFIGGSDVDTTDGFPLAADTPLTVNVDSGEILYAITATTGTVNVLRS